MKRMRRLTISKGCSRDAQKSSQFTVNPRRLASVPLPRRRGTSRQAGVLSLLGGETTRS